MQETQVPSLGGEDPLEKGMATHSSIHGYSPWGRKKRHLPLGRKAMTNWDSVLKSRDITLPTKVCLGQSYGFSGSHVGMWELDHKDGWAPKSWCFEIVVLEKTFESSKEIKPVKPKENQPCIFIGRTDAKAETPVLCPLDRKSWLISKDPDAEKDWGQEKRVAEEEMVG